MSEKVCTGCAQLLKLSCFSRDSRSRDGLCHKCKTCRKEAHFRWRNSPRVENAKAVPREGYKICTKCLTEKPICDFGLNSRAFDLKMPSCKVCVRAASKAWNNSNLEQRRAINAAWKAANPEKRKLARQAWNSANFSRNSANNKTWREANRHRVNAYASNRRAAIIQRTPKWLTEDDFSIMEFFYEWAKAIEVSTGIEQSVDHIIPLQGALVCGLHVPSNLQVISASENFKKSNSWNPDQ